MQFIKTADGWYISQNKIDAFNIMQPDGNRADVCAWIDETRWVLKRFFCDPKSPLNSTRKTRLKLGSTISSPN